MTNTTDLVARLRASDLRIRHDAADRIEALEARVAQVEAERDEARHHLAAIEPHTARGMTDNATPLFVRVLNMADELERTEAALTAEREALTRAEQSRDGHRHDHVEAIKRATAEIIRREQAEAALTAERAEVARLTAALTLDKRIVGKGGYLDIIAAQEAALARADALLARCHRRVKAEHHPDCDVLKGYDSGCSLECEDRDLLDDLAAHLRDREGAPLVVERRSPSKLQALLNDPEFQAELREEAAAEKRDREGGAKRKCPRCGETCAHGFCGRCEIALPDDREGGAA